MRRGRRVDALRRTFEAVTVFDRTVELLDLTIADEGLKGRQKELTRTLEVLWDAMFDGRIYEIDLASLDRHFPTPPWPPEPTVSGARWKDARYKTSPRFLKEQNE